MTMYSLGDLRIFEALVRIALLETSKEDGPQTVQVISRIHCEGLLMEELVFSLEKGIWSDLAR